MEIKEKKWDYADSQDKRSGAGIQSNTFTKDLHLAGIKLVTNWNYLDIGCRVCYTLSDLYSAGCLNVYGIDIGKAAESYWVNFPFRSNLKRWDVHNGIPFEGVMFDVVTISHVLEHCYDPEKVVEVIKGVLKKGGILHSIVPIQPKDDFDTFEQHLVRFDNHQEHLDFYTNRGFKLFFERYENPDSKQPNSIAIFHF